MQGGLRSASMQEGQSGFDACSTSYSDAHDRLHTDLGALSTVTVAVQGPIDPYRFNMFMSDLLAERGSDIKQMHGILSIQGYGEHGTHFKFEGAQQTVRFGPTVGTATDSQVTFSGHQLSAKDLQEALDSCTWLALAPGWTEHVVQGMHQPFYFHQATGCKQWQRPAAVETQPATPFRCHTHSPLASQGVAAQLSRPSSVGQGVVPDRFLQSRTKQKRHRSPVQSAVSCPCNASDACAAVFNIKCKGDQQRNAKRIRDEDVTSRLADINIEPDVTDVSNCSAIIDSASELEAARLGQVKLQHRKVGYNMRFGQNWEGKGSLERSSSCPWTPKQREKLTAVQC